MKFCWIRVSRANEREVQGVNWEAKGKGPEISWDLNWPHGVEARSTFPAVVLLPLPYPILSIFFLPIHPSLGKGEKRKRKRRKKEKKK